MSRPFGFDEHVIAILEIGNVTDEQHTKALTLDAARARGGITRSGANLDTHAVGAICAQYGIPARVYSLTGEPLCRVTVHGDVETFSEPLAGEMYVVRGEKAGVDLWRVVLITSTDNGAVSYREGSDPDATGDLDAADWQRAVDGGAVLRVPSYRGAGR